MDLWFFLVGCALFTSTTAFSLPYGPLGIDNNVSLRKIVKRSDRCAERYCHNGGQCEIEYGRTICRCPEKYSGEYCELKSCTTGFCKNGGRCYIDRGRTLCQCTEKYIGEYCETNRCTTRSCDNGGSCDVKNGRTICRCPERFIGEFCEIDLCAGKLCRNGGHCEVDNRRAVCRCTSGYTGETCEIAENPLKYCQYPGDIIDGWVDHVPNLNERKRPYDEIGDEYPEGSQLQYSCDDGYVLEGSSTLTCRSTGSWSSRTPTCKRVITVTDVLYCESPEPFINGQVVHQPTSTTVDDDTLYGEGSRLDYSCNRGYTLVGSTTLICEKSGLWSGEPPVCRRNRNRPLSCKHPANIANAQVVHIPPLRRSQRLVDQPREEYPAGSRLEFNCDYGYTLEGPFVLTCQNNGRWTAKPPVCKKDERTEINYCENPGFVSNGRAQYFPPPMNESGDPMFDEYPEKSRLEFSCDEGYRLQGPRSVTCQPTGFWSGDIPSCVSDCGRSFMQTHNRVFNGSKTISGDWPWVVSLSVDNNGRASFICGGAVLNTHTVITAAHCLTYPFVLGKTLILRFGKHRFGVQGDDEEVLVRRSSRVIVHPDYSNKSFDSDIGLVFFQQRIRYSIRVQPICLPTRDSTAQNIEPGKVGYVGGWGETEDERSPDMMMLANLSVVSNKQCMEAYKQKKLVMTSNMFCAGYEDARQGVCSGDSGSPFVFYDNRIERYILEGLVSFGPTGQCGVAGKYALFTKVFRFLDWIIKLYNSRN